MNWNKHHSLIVAAMMSLVIISSVLLGMMIVLGMKELYLFFIVIVIIALSFSLYKQINLPYVQISNFLAALVNRDFTIHFPTFVNDRRLNQMYRNMNRIITLYHDNQTDVETHKLYYERILRIITHEIRNTIAPINSLSANMLQNIEKGKSMEGTVVYENISVIHSQTDNIIQFLNQYHQLTHLPTPARQPIHAGQLIQKIMLLLGNEPNVNLIKIIVSEQMTINADPGLLTLALINVVRNALQAVNGINHGNIEIVVSSPNGQPFITVTDNGSGITPDRMEDIFMPFYSTKQHGSGIGLCLSRQIMRLHGGDLIVSSIPNQRTTFSFVFS
jgi:signal transduction histidine kinase